MSDVKLIEVRLPGSAYQVLVESDIPEHEPELWKRVNDHSRIVRQGQGIQRRVSANADDLGRLADYYFSKSDSFATMSAQERGPDGYATLRACKIAMARIVDALTNTREKPRSAHKR